MRTVLVAVLLCVLAPLAVADQHTPRTITVFGEASTTIDPDQVVWHLNISTRDKDLAAATATAETIVDQALAIGKKLGLSRDQMLIGRISVSMNYEYKNGEYTGKLSYYQLSQQLTFMEPDLERYDDFRTALTSVEGLQVNQQFVASGVEEARDRMRIEALTRARQKAEDLAAVVDAKVGQALSVSEFEPGSVRPPMEKYAMAMDGIAGQAKPEGTEVSARIYAVFELK